MSRNKANNDTSKLSAHIAVLVALLLVAGGLKGYSLYDASRHPERMAQLELAYEERQQQALDAAELVRQKQLEYAAGDDSGIDASRIERDGGIAEGIMKTALGWKDYDSYIDARETLKSRYGLSEDDRFLSVFLPYVSESEPTSSGKRYNWIDVNDYRVYYDGMEQHFLGTDGNAYGYLAEVKWSSVASNGGELRQESVFLYSIDADGGIVSMDAYITD